MKSRAAWGALGLFLLSGARAWAGAPGPERPVVVVFQIEDKSQVLEASLLGTLSEYIGSTIAEGGIVQIVPPGDLKRALLERKQESHNECYDQKCQVELGRELAASKTLASSILKIGQTCTITLTLFDLKRAVSDRSSNTRGGCGAEELMRSIDQAVVKIREGVASGLGLLPAPQAPSPVPAQSSAPIEARPTVTAKAPDKGTNWGKVTLWTGVGLVALGGGSGLLAKISADKYKESLNPDKRELSDTCAKLMWVGLGTGAVAFLTGLLWPSAKTVTSPPQTAAAWSLQPVVGGLVFSHERRW